jgi:hypothetical protein
MLGTKILSACFVVFGAQTVVATNVAAANVLKDCSAGTSVFKYGTASLTPDPLVRGQDATLSVSCTIPDGVTVTSGSTEYSLTYNGIPFSPTVEDLCSQVECPMKAGPYSNSTRSVFPDVSGKIVTRMKWFDEKKQLLYCLETTVKV